MKTYWTLKLFLSFWGKSGSLSSKMVSIFCTITSSQNTAPWLAENQLKFRTTLYMSLERKFYSDHEFQKNKSEKLRHHAIQASNWSKINFKLHGHHRCHSTGNCLLSSNSERIISKNDVIVPYRALIGQKSSSSFIDIMGVIRCEIQSWVQLAQLFWPDMTSAPDISKKGESLTSWNMYK